MTALLVVDNLTKRFGGLKAVDGVSFAVGEGEVVSVIGPNGSGKTTTLNMVCGALAPASGTVTLGGARISGRPAHRIAELGLTRTFQNGRVIGNLTVTDNVAVGLEPLAHRPLAALRRFPGLRWVSLLAEVVTAITPTRARAARRVADGERIAAELNRFGSRLTPRAQHFAYSLSYANRRRTEIARALVSRPRLLVLDEPTAGMNQSETTEVLQQLQALKAAGQSILLVEHKLDLVMTLSDRIIVLDEGTVIAEGTPAEVRRDPRVIEAYLGKAFTEEASA